MELDYLLRLRVAIELVVSR